MSDRMRRLVAGLKVSMIFGLVWSVLVTLFVAASGLITGRNFSILQYVLMLLFYSVLGAIQGLIVAASMAWSGERRGLTVDTYPRLLGAIFGVITGAAGVVLITVAELWGKPLNLWQAIPWTGAWIAGAFGGLATVTLLTVARRGALPPAPPERNQIGS